VPSLSQHPLPALRDAGVAVTLNSDDPGMFDTSLTKEYEIAAACFGFDRDALTDLARAAVRYSRADDARQRALLAEIDAYALGG